MVKNFLCDRVIVPKAVFSKIAPDKIPAETNLKPIGSGPYKLDKYDQTQVNLTRDDNYWGKTVYGTPAPTTHQPPDLQEQQRRRRQAGERRDRRQPAVHRADLEDVGGGQAGLHLDEEEAVPRSRQIPLLIFNLNKPGLNNLEGPAGHRVRDRLPEHRHHGHVGLLRAGQCQPDHPDRLRGEVLRRRRGQGRRLDLRQGQGHRPSWRTT